MKNVSERRQIQAKVQSKTSKGTGRLVAPGVEGKAIKVKEVSVHGLDSSGPGQQRAPLNTLMIIQIP